METQTKRPAPFGYWRDRRGRIHKLTMLGGRPYDYDKRRYGRPSK